MARFSSFLSLFVHFWPFLYSTNSPRTTGFTSSRYHLKYSYTKYNLLNYFIFPNLNINSQRQQQQPHPQQLLTQHINTETETQCNATLKLQIGLKFYLLRYLILNISQYLSKLNHEKKYIFGCNPPPPL